MSGILDTCIYTIYKLLSTLGKLNLKIFFRRNRNKLGKIGTSHPIFLDMCVHGVYISLALIYGQQLQFYTFSGYWIIAKHNDCCLCRRLEADRFFTSEFNEHIYSKEGFKWVNTTEGLKDVLRRHHPELVGDWMSATSAFSVWNQTPDTPNYWPLYLRWGTSQ